MAPPAAAVPAGQGLQVDAFVAAGSLLKVLGAHCVVLAVPAGVTEPRGQQTMEPGALNWLAGQGSAHAGWPAMGLYLPAAQGAQEVALAAGWNEPGAQGWHTDELVAPTVVLKEPALQLVHADAPTRLKAPAAQGRHDAGALA